MAAGIFRRSFTAIAVTAIVSVALTACSAYLLMRRLYADANGRALGEAARALAAAIPIDAMPMDPRAGFDSPLARYARHVASESDFRLTIVMPDGTVAADSKADPATMDNHATRPEIARALGGGIGTASRRSSTIGMELFYAAAPVMDEGRVAGALRIATDLPAFKARLGPARLALLIVALAATLAALAAAAFYSRRVARPLALLASAAKEYASIPSRDAIAARPRFLIHEGPEELRVLGLSLESMAAELSARIASAETASLERRALLDGMSEAVLSLDGNLAINLANPAAAALFGLPAPEAAIGKSLLAASRSTELESAAKEAVARGERFETELALYGEGERWFQVVASPLRSLGGGDSGLVLVLNDITRLRRLERIRRDFVANVSHELRTPVQLVKGFSEQLGEGALDDPARAARFVDIIRKNASHMEDLINDLLTLARLEQGGSLRLERESTRLSGILEAARESVLPKAEAKGIAITLECEDALEARLNPGLVEQAITNLLDNAVKFSPEGRPVLASAHAQIDADLGPVVVLEVRDRGPGIPAGHLPRIFERFYRVDKGRSRELGGTGLGLAIVNHIAMAHGGKVSVESWEGEGSRFRIAIPRGSPES